MADVRVAIADADGYLPDVCCRCGEEATTTKTKNMSWCPPWVGVLILFGLLPYLIVMLIMTKRARVQVPFCDRHKGHWLYRTLLILATLAIFVVLGILSIVVAAILKQPGNDDFFGYAALACVVLFLTWLVIAVIAQQTAIRAKEITDTEIVLTGVGVEFAEAVDDVERERRLRWKKKRSKRGEDEDDEEEDEDEDDFEPPPRKKKASSSDAIKEDRRTRRRDEDDEEPPPRKKKRPAEDDD